MAKIGERGFTVDTIYQNRHNRRYAKCTKIEISDIGSRLYRLEEWATNKTGEPGFDWMTDSCRQHWMIASRGYDMVKKNEEE